MLNAKRDDPLHPMGDFELEVHIPYELRQDDPDWSEEDDNILTERVFLVRKDEPDELLDEGFKFPSLESVNFGLHCYLLHDLYGHHWGPGKQSLTLKECLRIGEIQFDGGVRNSVCEA